MIRSIAILFCIALVAFATGQQPNQCPTVSRLRDRMEPINPNRNDLSRQLQEEGMHDRLSEIITQVKEIDTTSTKLECLFGGNETFNRVKDMVANLGLGVVEGCISQINYEYTKNHEQNAKRLEKSLTRFEDSFAEFGGNVLQDVPPPTILRGKKFLNPIAVGEIPWSSPSDTYHECTIHRADVMRVDGSWYYLAELTNAESTEDLPPRSRFFYRELFRLDENNNTQIRTVSIPNCRDPSFARRSGKAWIEVWGGKANASLFRDGSLEDDSALRMVLESIDGRENDIVMDSDTASNTAILLLPVTLALIPLSLFQDVGTLMTVLYVIATDVMSVLPVAIKGVELLILAAREHYARAAYAYGSPTSQVLVVEMWVSKCHLKDVVRNRGIILLTVAISATVFGLILEFVIRHQVEKYKRVNNSNLAKELEIEERHSLDPDRRSSLYSERVVNYIQKGGTGGLLFHMKQKKEFREEP